MMPGRTTEIVALLKHSKQILDEAVAGVTEEEAAARPNTGGWSILQVIEHVALAERGMLSRFEAAQKSETSLENPAREARILAGGADRSTKMQAPETAGPAGRFETLQEACGQFAAARKKTIRF